MSLSAILALIEGIKLALNGAEAARSAAGPLLQRYRERRGKATPQERCEALETLVAHLEDALEIQNRALRDLTTVAEAMKAQIDWLLLPFYKRWFTPRPIPGVRQNQPGIQQDTLARFEEQS